MSEKIKTEEAGTDNNQEEKKQKKSIDCRRGAAGYPGDGGD